MKRTTTAVVWFYIIPGLFAAVSTGSRHAHAQTPACTSCNLAMPCDQQIDQIIMNEDGGSPTHFVRVCGPGDIDLPSKHATLLTVPAGTQVTHVCIAARSTSGNNQPAEVFYASSDPLTGLPEADQGTTNFFITPGDSHQIVQVNWALGGTWWVGVRYPAGACHLSEQGTRARLTGDAAVWISGDAWRRYDNVGGGAGYNQKTPIIRLISSISNRPSPQVLVTPLAAQLQTDEAGAGFPVSVELSHEPCYDVLVQAISTDPSEGDVSSSILFFTAQNWNVPQIVNVFGVDDLIVDGDVTYQVRFSALITNVADICYDGLVNEIDVINLDNDVAGTQVCPPGQPAWVPRPTLVPPPLVFARMANDAQRERVVMFGGDMGPAQSGETFEWDGTDWQLVAPAGPGAPSPRHLHAMSYDSARGVVVLTGGIEAGLILDDTWEWDGFTWQLRAAGPAGAGGPRHWHAQAYDESRGVTVLYGGFPSTPETWEWDGNVWTAVTTPTIPAVGERHMHAMVYDAGTQRVLMFGGLDQTGMLGDIWAYDGADWTPVNPQPGPTPTPRLNASWAYDRSRGVSVLYGGEDVNGLIQSDTWEWDDATLTWTPIPAPITPRTWHAAAFDTARCHVVVYGGHAGGAPLPPETLTYPENLLAFGRSFCVLGAATGADWSWSLGGTAGGGWLVENQNTPGVAAGAIADVIVQQFVDSINNSGCCTVSARVNPAAPFCFDVATSDPAGFDLCVGAAGAPPTCCVVPGASCSFNPDIFEIVLSGSDCNANGMDDTIDLLIDPSLDSDGDGIIDSCVTYLLGDLNCDGQVDGNDVAAFTRAQISPADYAAEYPGCQMAAGDFNGDGAVDPGDNAAFVQLLTGP